MKRRIFCEGPARLHPAPPSCTGRASAFVLFSVLTLAAAAKVWQVPVAPLLIIEVFCSQQPPLLRQPHFPSPGMTYRFGLFVGAIDSPLIYLYRHFW